MQEDSIGEGSEPTTTDPIADANTAAERLEAANKEKERLLKRDEDLEVRKRLGGHTLGIPQPEPVKKVDTPEEYATKVLNGEINPLTANE